LLLFWGRDVVLRRKLAKHVIRLRLNIDLHFKI
jgi:hypothetical protein